MRQIFLCVLIVTLAVGCAGTPTAQPANTPDRSSTETAIAGKGGKREEIVHEAADLLFHLLVLLGYYDIPWEAVCGELRRRFGTSGLEEKNSRDPSAKEPS